jgi:hypothetical protein
MINIETFDYKDYLKSDYWKYIKREVHERDGYKCRQCNSEDNLCVHHLKYDNLYNEDLNYLITLCKKCHYKLHKTYKIDSFNSYRENYINEKRNKEKSIITNEITRLFHECPHVLDIIKEIIVQQQFIKINDIKAIVKKNIKSKISINRFVWYILDYFDMLLVLFANEEVKQKYNFPKRMGINYNEIAITKDLYLNNSENIHIIHRE